MMPFLQLLGHLGLISMSLCVGISPLGSIFGLKIGLMNFLAELIPIKLNLLHKA